MPQRPETNRLTSVDYWNSRYSDDVHMPSRVSGGLAALGRRFLPARCLQGHNCLARWAVIDRFFPRAPNVRLFEVGCAPGRILISYHLRYGCDVWGIDYASEGVSKARRLLETNGLDPSQIIEGDFLASETLARFHNFFDVVTSHGFIEHFEDPRAVVGRHVTLVRPGGYLIVQVPNLLWFNYFRVRFSYPDRLRMHNLEIMRLPAFKSLFETLRLRVLFVGYLGTLTLRHLLPEWLPDLDSWMDKLLALCLGPHMLPTRFFSPWLLCVAQKPVQCREK